MLNSTFNDTYNKDLVNIAVDKFKLNPLTDRIPNKVVGYIQPVVDLKRVAVINSTTLITESTGSANVHVTSAGKSFYLTSVTLSTFATAAADNTIIGLAGTNNGNFNYFIAMVKPTLTAYSNTITLTYDTPIKFDAGTNVVIINSYTVGASTTFVALQGYEE